MADRKNIVALALLALLFVGTDLFAQFQPNTWLFRDGRFYTNVNENIVQAGSFEDPFAASWYSGTLGWNRNLSADFSNVALGARGEHYHFRPWILPVLSTPLYFALGLLGVLLFNLSLYAVIAAGTYRFLRAYIEPLPAAAGTLAMVMASGFREHAYNYSVDLLLVAAFLGGLWALMERRGALAGALVAIAVMIKPTTLLYAPGLALVMWERKDGRTLTRAIGGGSAVLGGYALMNWYMFGRPWATGYTRVLTLVNGVETIHSDTGSFETPFADGARALLDGPDGLLWWHAIFLLAIPGLLVLVRRWPRTGLAISMSAALAYVLFAHFTWHHNRLLFPAVALFSLPLALGMRTVGGGLRALVTHWMPLSRASALVIVVAFAALIASAFTGGALPTRHPDEAAVQGAIAIGEGAFDLREASSDVAWHVGALDSTVSIARDGAWVPRAPLLALLPLAPLAHLSGRYGVVAGTVLLACLLIASLAWLLRRRVPTPLAAALALGALWVGPMREACLQRPVETLAALLLIAGLARASSEESDARAPFLASAVMVGLAGATLELPLLGVLASLGVALLARFRSRALVLPTLGAGLGAVALGLLVSWLWWGHPLASAEDQVIVAMDGARAALGHATFGAAVSSLAEGPSLSRALLPLVLALPLTVAALVFDARRDRRMLVALGVLLAALAVPGVAMRGGVLAPIAIITLVSCAGLSCVVLAERIAELLAHVRPARLALAAGLAVLALLLGIGLTRRAQAEASPFWIGSASSVREASVFLGAEDASNVAPCDFLAWENMAWECAMLDGGAMGRVGLALPDSPRVADRVVRGMLLIPTALRRGDERRVRWEDVRATERLHLVVGAPDGEFTSPADVVVRIDDVEVAQFTVVRDEGGLRDVVIDTPDAAGHEVRLEIEMRATRRGQQAAIVLAGGFVP